MKIFCLALALLSSCTAVKSSVNCTLGTECLESKDYDGAKEYLAASVDLQPTSQNLNSLACACIGKGEYEEAWKHSCKAVNANFGDVNANLTNMNLFTNYIVPKYKLNEKGWTVREIIDQLGEPDFAVQNTVTNELRLAYGTAILKFKEGKYVYYMPRMPATMNKDWRFLKFNEIPT